MAQYDGSVKIDTSLDNSGFDKGSKELEAAIKDLTTEIKAMGQKMQQSFDQYTRAIQGAITSTNSMRQTVSNTADSAHAVNETKEAVDGLGQSAQMAESSAKNLGQSLGKTGKTTGTAQQLSKEITTLGKQVASLEGLSEKASNGSGSAAEKLRTGYDKASQSVASLEEKLAQLGNQEIPTDDYQWMCDEIDKVSAKLEKLEDKKAKMESLGTGENTRGFKSLQYDIDQSKANLQDLIATKKEMESDGSAFKLNMDTAPFQNMKNQLSQIKQSMAEIRSGNPDILQAPDPSGWSRTGSAVKSTANAFGSMMRTAGSGLVTGLKKVGSLAGSAAKSLAGMAKTSIANGIKHTGSALTGLGRSSKSSNSGLAGGLKMMLRYGLGVRSLFALINRLRSVISDAFGSLAQYDPQFNSVISSFIGSLKQLGNAFAAAFSPVLQVVLPILTILINAIAEAVNRIGMMIAALTGKNSFVKATKVQYNYAKAQASGAKGASDSADALKDEAGAAEEAKKQLMGFDDVNILSEDDSKNKNGSGAGSGAGGAGGGGGGWTEVPVDDTASAWADALKEAWENADFTKIGRTVGEKLRDALEKIPWDKIKLALRKIAKCIATFLNGFLETPGLFTVIGKTMAEALNSAFEFVDSFIQNFHWNSLGKAIKDGILGFCENIDWELIYRTFRGLGSGIGTALQESMNNPRIWKAMLTTAANGLDTVVYGLYSFMKTVEWDSFGKNIATGLNTGVQNVDWNAVSQTLIAAINGIFDFWYQFITTFDFWKFSNQIGLSISTAIRGINWMEGGYSVGATITGLFDTLNGFIEGVDWGELGKAVIDAIAGFFQGFDWASVGKFLSNCITGLYNFFSGAVEEIDWGAVGEYILQTVCDFFQGFDWSGICQAVAKAIGTAFMAAIKVGGWLWNTMKEFGKNIIEGGWKGITDKIASVGRWVRDNIFVPFINGFKDAFGIHSPSREMEPMGAHIVDGLWLGITDTFHKVTDFFRHSGRDIRQAIMDCLNWFENAGAWIVSGIQNGIAGAWSNLCTTVTRWCSNLWSSIVSFFRIGSPSKLMRDTVGRWIPLGVAEGIEDTTGDAVDSVRTMAQAIADEAENTQAILPVDTVIDDSVSGLDAVLTTFADKVASSFDNLVSSLDRLVSRSDFRLPAMATGSVTPYGTGSRRSNSTMMQDMAEALLKANDNSISKEELRSLLVDLAKKIDGISFFIGDQDLARHVNKGNETLNRRFKVG